MKHFSKSKKDLIKFTYRTIILLTVLSLLILNEQILIDFFNYKIISNIQIYKLIWVIMIIIMLKSFIPRFSNKIAPGKIFKKYYKISNCENKEVQINTFTLKSNIGAIKAAIFFLLKLSLIGILYYLGVISNIHLFILSAFLYWLDGFYMLIWCPYRNIFLKNKCCHSCRIYNWGYFMIVAPLIFINNFYTYSLVILSLLIIVKWEVIHILKPERFSEISNENLRCSNCTKENCANKKIIK